MFPPSQPEHAATSHGSGNGSNRPGNASCNGSNNGSNNGSSTRSNGGPGRESHAMRICIVADNASTRFGGESFLPLNYFRLLRRRGVDAWLVTHERVRAELETLLPHEIDRIRFVRDSLLHKTLYALGKPLPRRVRENTTSLAISMLTQWMQRIIIRGLVRAREINVVHQPSPVS